MRKFLSWVLYYAGDIVHRPMAWTGLFSFLYHPYNWLMSMSVKVQGKGDGPWQTMKGDSTEG